MKRTIILALSLLFLVSAVSGVYYEKEVDMSFQYYPGGGELRVEGPGIAKFLDCNTTCSLSFNVSGTASCGDVGNLTALEYGLHTAITQARDKVMQNCSANKVSAVCNCSSTVDYNRIFTKISGMENDTRSILKDKIGGIIDCRELDEELKDCKNKYMFLEKDVGVSLNETRRLRDELSQMRRERDDLKNFLFLSIAISLITFAWASGWLKTIIRRK